MGRISRTLPSWSTRPFPDLIGTQGAVIRKIKEALKVEVNIPPVPKNAPPGKKYAVTIAGKKEDAENAKKVIEDIVMFYHHPITHEGMEHLEMQIDPWSYSYLIGTKVRSFDTFRKRLM